MISFSGATNDTASRTAALVADPDCRRRSCRVWAGASGGGVWRTDNASPADPNWKQVSPDDLDQNSVGTLTLDPTDSKHDTLYLGTGEGNRCSSGCEAGVGIYKSTERRQALDEARRHVRQQRDVPVREPRARTRSSAAGSTGSSSTRATATTSSSARRRASAVFRTRSATAARPASSRARTSPASTSRPTAARRSPRSGTGTTRAASASRTSGSTRSTWTPSTRRRSTLGVAA